MKYTLEEFAAKKLGSKSNF